MGFGSPSRRRLLLLGPAVLFGLLLAVGAITTSGFLTEGNLKSILLSSAFAGIIAVGMTPITIGGNLFSLSLGITAAVCAMAFTQFLRLGFGEAIVLALAIAAVLVGGNAVAGGRGSAIQSALGALVIAAVTSIALLRGYSTGVQILIRGVILLGVVVLVHTATKGRTG
jgi:ribose/xylose/arabinose/galactoside ABC-type transport system permease subunit